MLTKLTETYEICGSNVFRRLMQKFNENENRLSSFNTINRQNHCKDFAEISRDTAKHQISPPNISKKAHNSR